MSDSTEAESTTRRLAVAVIMFAHAGGMPDTYWATDTRIALACQVLGLTTDEARELDEDYE